MRIPTPDPFDKMFDADLFFDAAGETLFYNGHTNWSSERRDSRMQMFRAEDLSAVDDPVIMSPRNHIALLSDDGSSVVFRSVFYKASQVRVFDVERREQMKPVEFDTPVQHAIVSPDGREVFAIETDGRFSRANLETERQEQVFSSNESFSKRPVTSPDGRFLAVSTGRDMVLVCEPGREDFHRWTIHVPTSGADLFFSDCGRRIVVQQTALRRAFVFALPLNHETEDTAYFRRPAWTFGVSPDGRKIVASEGEPTTTFQVFDVERRRFADWKLKHTENHGAAYDAPIAFSHSGDRVYTGGNDGHVFEWDLETGERTASFPSGEGRIWGIDITSDDRYLAACGPWVGEESVGPSEHEGEFYLWDLEKRELLHQPIRFKRPSSLNAIAWGVRFSPGGRFVCVRTTNVAEIWDVVSGEPVQELTHPGYVTSTKFSRDSRHLLTACTGDGKIRIWDIESGETVRMMEHEAVREAWYSADEKRVFSYGRNRQFSVWDARTGKPMQNPIVTEDAIFDAQLVGSNRLAVTEMDGTVSLWSLSDRNRIWSGTAHAPMPRFEGMNCQIALGSGANLFFTGDGSGIVRRWDISTPMLTPLIESEIDKLIGLEFAQNASRDFLKTLECFERLSASFPEYVGPEQFDSSDWSESQMQLGLLEETPFRTAFHKAEEGNSEVLAEPRIRRLLDRKTGNEVSMLGVFPKRDADTDESLIDLTPFYTHRLDENLVVNESRSNGLDSFPVGVGSFGGVEFDVRGMVVVADGSKSQVSFFGQDFKPRSGEIHIGKMVEKLHLLHMAVGSNNFGSEVGNYRIVYRNGLIAEIPIVTGMNISDWWAEESDAPLPEPEIAWRGSNPSHEDLRVHRIEWTNPLPNEPLESIELIGGNVLPIPVLLGVTIE